MTRWQHSRIGIGLGFGILAGGAEVALRASPQQGMAMQELLQWWLIGAGTSAALALLVVAVFRVSARPIGAVFAALLCVHGVMLYRYAVVVNRFLRDPAVWGGALAIGLVSAGLGLALQRVLVDHTGRLVRWSLGLGALSLPLTLWLGQPTQLEAEAEGPNVILITVDTLRPDRLGVYGADNRTPVIDGLAKNGVRFQTAVTPAPLTQPAHLAILTGRPPHVTGVVSNGTDIGERPALLQHVLKKRGYRTGGFVSGFPLHGRFGWGQGMDVYDDDFSRTPGLHRLNMARAWDLVAQTAHTLRERRGDAVVGRAINWLQRVGDDRFFLWIHLFDPHAPYEAPDHPFDPPTTGEPLDLPSYWPAEHRRITSEAWLTEAYDAEIRYTDAQLGRLLAVLKHNGQLANALVVLTADHGESLTEHGLLFDHGDDLMAPSLRVPLIFNWPGQIAPAEQLCLASNMDVTPTVLGLLEIGDSAERHGLDRSATLRGGDCEDAPLLATTVSGRFVDPPPIDHALRWPGAKRLQHANGEVGCWRVPDALDGEQEMPQCPPGMDGAMQVALEQGTPPDAPRSDPETTEALRALGYIE